MTDVTKRIFGGPIDTLRTDGTAGRVLRVLRLLISNGTTGVGLKCTTTSQWNGDANSEVDNIAKNATTGVYNLDSGGIVLTLLNSGISGDCVAIIGVQIVSNASTVVLTTQIVKDATGILIILRKASDNVAQDITTLVDTGDIYLDITYVTSA